MDLEFGQPDLVTGILNWLHSHGVKSANARQMNAVIAAAAAVVDELRRDDVQATAGVGLGAWLASDSTGLSSRYMARVLAPVAGLGGVPEEKADWRGIHHPHDVGDFGRCVRLLDAVPELRPHLADLAKPDHGPKWAGLIAAWDELESMYRAEIPTGRAPKTYARIREIVWGG